MKKHYCFLLILTFYMSFCALGSIAADRAWINGDGDWNDTGHWAGGVVPAVGDNAYLTNSAGNTLVNYVNPANPQLSSLHVASTNGGSITVTQVQDNLIVTGNVIIAEGAGTKGVFVQNGGTNIMTVCTSSGPERDFVVAYDEKSTGVYHLVSGFLSSLSGRSSWGYGPVFIGCNGDGTFIQDGGRFQGNTNPASTNGVDRVISVGGFSAGNIGRSTGGRGKYYLNGGVLAFDMLAVGSLAEANGLFQQNGGTNYTRLRIYVGNYGTGRYEMNGGLCYNGTFGPVIIGGNGGQGTLNMTGGTFQIKNTAVFGDQTYIGNGTNATGAMNFSGGDFYSYQLLVGYNCATGVVNQTGGAMRVGSDSGASFGGLVLGLTNGCGQYNFGDAAASGIITNYGTLGRDLTICKDANSRGVFRGWGEVYLKDSLINNGVVIADGYGTNRTLNFSRFKAVSNLIENGIAGTNGWYARGSGKLTLPLITVLTGNSTNNWGEQNGDSVIDLVNSVRMVFTNVTVGGIMTNSLVATDCANVPALPMVGKVLGVWEFKQSSGLTFDTLTATFRYDDAAWKKPRINSLLIYRHNGVAWERLAVTLDTANRLLTTTVNSVGASDYYVIFEPILRGTIFAFR